MTATYRPRANSSRRPKSKFDGAKVFIECVSCGAYKVLSGEVDITDEEATRRAHLSGWSIAGAKRAKTTRCGKCRKAGVRHRRFADTDPRYGMFSRGNPLLRPRSV